MKFDTKNDFSLLITIRNIYFNMHKSNSSEDAALDIFHNYEDNASLIYITVTAIQKLQPLVCSTISRLTPALIQNDGVN